MPDNKEKLQEKYLQYKNDYKDSIKKDYKEDFDKAYKGKGEYFKIKDLKYNKRQGLVYPKSVIDDLVKASYKEGVDPTEALSTMMRESGGNDNPYYNPRDLFNSASNPIANKPTFQQYLMSKYPYGNETKHGMNFHEWDYVNSKELKNVDKDYADYQNKVKNWQSKFDELDPFQSEIRWMKKLGVKGYNLGEKDRQGQLNKETDIIKANPDLYNYMQKKYNDYKGADMRKEDQKLGPVASINPKEGQVSEIPYTRTLSKVIHEPSDGKITNDEGKIVWGDIGLNYYKVYDDGSKQQIPRNEYQKWTGYNQALESVKQKYGTETVNINDLSGEEQKIAKARLDAQTNKQDQ
jgi:hypothetical protein